MFTVKQQIIFMRILADLQTEQMTLQAGTICLFFLKFSESRFVYRELNQPLYHFA